MNLQIPPNFAFRKGDLAAIMKGYFLVTGRKPLKPIVTSQILSFLADAVHKVTVFHTDNTFKDYVANWLKSYGVEPNEFADYVYQNKAAILICAGDYMVIQDLLAQWAKLAQIQDKYKLTLPGFIDYLGDVVSSTAGSLSSGIGDTIAEAIKGVGKPLLKPVITVVIIALAVFFIYGLIKSKYYAK